MRLQSQAAAQLLIESRAAVGSCGGTGYLLYFRPDPLPPGLARR